MPRFAANLSMMFTEVPFLDRFDAAAQAGFTAVEFLFPYEHPAEAVGERLKRNGLTQALFNLPPGDWNAGEKGFAALPARFKWALVLLALSALVLIAARWPRLGPPEPPDDPLFPPRRAYVDALAATLARTHDRTAALEAVRSAGRERLARRAALPRDATAETWTAAARAAGLSDEEARALQDITDDDGIAAGRALARLSRGRH